MNACVVCGEDITEVVRPVETVQVVACGNCRNVSLLASSSAPSEVVAGIQQLTEIVKPGSVMAEVMGHVSEGITQLPILNETAQQVMAATTNPDASIADVVALLENDVALTTKILSVANSAFYATVREIVDLPTACSRLGMKSVANVVNTMACAEQFKTDNQVAKAFMQSLWQHAIVTANCSEALAAKFGMEGKLAFIAGLLHDVGKIVLVNIITTMFADKAERLLKSPDILVKAIDPLAPIIGLHVIQHWKLAQGLTFSTLFVDAPNSTPGDDETKDLAHCVRLASDIASMKGYGVLGQEKATFDNHPSIEYIGTNPEELTRVAASFDDMIDSFLGAVGKVG